VTRRERLSERKRLDELVRDLRRPLPASAAGASSDPAQTRYLMELMDRLARSVTKTWPGAVAAAEGGDLSPLLDCMRAYKTFADGDRELLASFVARRIVRRRLWPRQLERVLTRARDDFDLLHVAALDRLAKFVERRRPGGAADKPVHRTAREVEIALRTFWPGRVPEALREVVIERYCVLMGRVFGVSIDPERVRDLMRRPKARRSRY
jgi:hypothetical protein